MKAPHVTVNTTIVLMLHSWSFVAHAQRTLGFNNSVVTQTRIDLRDLGYPPIDVIPSGESAVRALTVAPNGVIWGATSGKRSHLFTLDPKHGYIQPLGYLNEITTVHRAIVATSNAVYIGGSIGVDVNGSGYAAYAGGHLLKYTPGDDYARAIHVDAACPTTDLGIAAPGEGIYALALDRTRKAIYGLTYPNGRFFSYEIDAGRFTTFGSVAEHTIRGERFEHEKNIGRALAINDEGVVFTSGEGGELFRFDPARAKLERTGLIVPTVPGREPYNRVDAWTISPSGDFYGGTSDGYLFRFDSKASKVENLGKPLNQYRIRGLAFAPNRELYGIGGADDEMARLFSYDPARGSYRMLGFIDVNRRPYYTWQAYVIDSVVAGLDGTIFLGQSERKSKLYLYYPE